MKLEVDKTTINYIKEKGMIINIDLYAPKSCCAGAAEPVVGFGSPRLLHQFDEYIVDDVKIYVSKFIHLKDDTLTIKMNRFLGIRNISVSGVKIF